MNALMVVPVFLAGIAVGAALAIALCFLLARALTRIPRDDIPDLGGKQ